MTVRDKFASLAALKPTRKNGAISRLAPRHRRAYAPALPEGAERLAQLLQAAASTNDFGEHLTVRKWFSEPIGPPPPDGTVKLPHLPPASARKLPKK